MTLVRRTTKANVRTMEPSVYLRICLRERKQKQRKKEQNKSEKGNVKKKTSLQNEHTQYTQHTSKKEKSPSEMR